MTIKSETTAHGAATFLLCSVLLAGCSSFSDGFTEETSAKDQTVEQGMIKGLMESMGAIDPHEKPIDHKPRAPLVVPPNRSLPTPRDADAQPSPNFPRNPEDVAEEQRKAAADGDTGNNGRIMTPDQLAKFAMPGAGRPTGRQEDPSRRLSPDELNGQGAVQTEAVKRAANPTGRQSLIEPPDQYRKPSPNAPVAAPEEKSSWKPSWWPL